MKKLLIVFLMFTGVLRGADKDIYNLFTKENTLCVEQCDDRDCVFRCYQYYIGLIYELTEKGRIK